MENGEPVFTKPQDTLKRVKVTYHKVQKEKQQLDTSKIVKILRKWGGVSFDIGPILYVD
jgi:intergrase/recombinase